MSCGAVVLVTIGQSRHSVMINISDKSEKCSDKSEKFSEEGVGVFSDFFLISQIFCVMS